MAESTPDLRSQPMDPGCPMSQVRKKLRKADLRPTLQRVSLGWLLFGKGERHVTAEMLFEEAKRARIPVTLATVYNTLHQFRRAGLLQQIPADGRKVWFDTNVSEHHHYLIEGGDEMVDVSDRPMNVVGVPAAPDGYEIAKVDVIVRLRAASSRS